jgi:hypothetical protein
MGNVETQDLQKQALKLPTSDRWQLVQTLLESLKVTTQVGAQGRSGFL